MYIYIHIYRYTLNFIFLQMDLCSGTTTEKDRFNPGSHSDRFPIERNVIVVTASFPASNKTELHSVQNRRENNDCDHIPSNLKGKLSLRSNSI